MKIRFNLLNLLKYFWASTALRNDNQLRSFHSVLLPYAAPPLYVIWMSGDWHERLLKEQKYLKIILWLSLFFHLLSIFHSSSCSDSREEKLFEKHPQKFLSGPFFKHRSEITVTSAQNLMQHLTVEINVWKL